MLIFAMLLLLIIDILSAGCHFFRFSPPFSMPYATLWQRQRYAADTLIIFRHACYAMLIHAADADAAAAAVFFSLYTLEAAAYMILIIAVSRFYAATTLRFTLPLMMLLFAFFTFARYLLSLSPFDATPCRCAAFAAAAIFSPDFSPLPFVTLILMLPRQRQR